VKTEQASSYRKELHEFLKNSQLGKAMEGRKE